MAALAWELLLTCVRPMLTPPASSLPQAFPVTPEVEKALGAAAEPFELHGVVLRSTLLHLLRSRRGFVAPQQATALRMPHGGGGGGRGPGRAVRSESSGDDAAAAAAAQLE